VKQKIFFFIFALIAALAVIRPNVARAETAPMWFCAGVEPWIIPDGGALPDEAPCGPDTGMYLVDKQDGQTQHFDWDSAKAMMDETEGTFWYQPYEQNVPAFFCQASDPWTIPLNALLPEWPVCPDGSGEYVMDINGNIERTADWSQARDMLWGNEATIFFERVEQFPPDGFCDGGVPWEVPGNNLLPEGNVCDENSGEYVIDVQGDMQRTTFWDSARFTMGDNAGTFWFEKSVPSTPSDPPDGFCQGGVPWQVPVNSILPDFEVCDSGSGTYVVEVGESQDRTMSWFEARDIMGTQEGTFWFEPVGDP